VLPKNAQHQINCLNSSNSFPVSLDGYLSLSLSLYSASDRFPQRFKRPKLQTLKSFKKQFGQNRGEEGTGRVFSIVFVPLVLANFFFLFLGRGKRGYNFN
jgi:hypothetical protein